MGQSSPRFRKDLVASVTEVEGVTFVDVSDAATGASFRLYDFEYQLAVQLDGQPIDQVVAWAATMYGMDLTAEGIAEFAGRLGELGFLEAAGSDEPLDVAMEIDMAPPGTVMAPAPTINSAEVEWLSLQNQKTSTFVPDAAMLQGSMPESGPTVPAPALPPTRLGFAAAPPAGSARRAGTPSGLNELLDDALTETSGPTLPPSSGALDLPPLPRAAGGPPTNGSGGASAGVPTRIGATGSAGMQAAGSAPTRHGPPPRGMIERRMPPLPEGVVMAPFQDEFSRSRFTAPPPARASRRKPLVVVALVIVAAAAGGGYYRWSQLHPSEPPARKLRVVSPKPNAVYRWFSTSGAVTDAGGKPLMFEGGGRVTELVSVGKPFVAGDVLGRLQGASALEAELAKQRPRLAAAQQARDSAKASGNQAQLRKAESALAERQKATDELQANLAKLLLRASEPGQITEAVVKVGATVPPKTLALKWKGKLLHGDFTLDEEDFAQAAKLEFCRVEVVPAAAAADPAAPAGAPSAPAEGRFIDCQLPPPAPAPTARSGSLLRKFLVTLPTGAGVATGQALRLARLRYDAVYALPLSAIVHADSGDKVWVASPLGLAQLRPVTVAESRDEALVSGGLAIGEDVVVEPPADLSEGARVAPVP